jgi:hypothetical protein
MMMLMSMDKPQIKNNNVYFCYILCLMNLIYILLEDGRVIIIYA